MRCLLQLLILTLLATAAKADLADRVSSFFGESGPSLPCPGPSVSPQEVSWNCSLAIGAAGLAFNTSVQYGRLDVYLRAQGADEPKLLALAHVVMGFSDEIAFSGPEGEMGSVTWFATESDYGSPFVPITEGVQVPFRFNHPFGLRLALDREVISSSSDHVDYFEQHLHFTGFQVYDAGGSPVDAGITTWSGYLYGGHAPEFAVAAPSGASARYLS